MKAEVFEDVNFSKRYQYFKSLLANNNKALSLINTMENIILEHQSFDYDEVFRQCEALISIVYEIAEDVNALAGGAYEELFARTERIGVSILRELMAKKRLDKSNWTISLSNLSHEDEGQVGNKAANLAEISNRVNLPAPRGFSITAFACHRFYMEAYLYKMIRREMRDLNVNDGESLERTCFRVQEMIRDAPLPARVSQAIEKELESLTSEFGENIRLAVRSSATGEDSQHSSFAGQHTSVLNVRPPDIIRAYKEVIASTFNPRAVFYRRRKGYRDLDVLMGVLCLMMIGARSSGCMYTINPSDSSSDDIFINANWGLGVSVVDGSMPTDYWQVSRADKRILAEDIPVKREMQVMGGPYDLAKAPVPLDKQNRPCLSTGEIKRLVDYGLRLEAHFGHPLDVEWAVDENGDVFILQARPLHRVLQDDHDAGEIINGDLKGYEILLEGGMTASPGTAAGPAHVLGMEYRLGDIPEGCILIANQTSPEYVPAMARIRGIITDVGSVTGHMASVAREFGIPAIVGTGGATGIIGPNELITMDASKKTVYKGRVTEILGRKLPVNIMRDSPVYKLIRQVLKKIVPLHLVDPNADNFTPAGCRTLHDVVRFSHEKAMREMFRIGEGIEYQKDRYFAMRLKTALPLRIYILDIGGGVKVDCGEEYITHNEISSIPFKALLCGMSHRDVRWGAQAGSAGRRQAAGEEESSGSVTHYAILSDEYVNFSVTLGDNYVTVDSFCSPRVNDNYIQLSFKGGAADICRRKRRAALVAGILKKLAFKVDQKVDMLVAEMKKYDMGRMEEKLNIIGRMLAAVRYLDVVLTDDGHLSWYVDEFLRGNYIFKSN